MAVTSHNQVHSSSSDEVKKQRKKQAKQEAELMLKLERIRKDVQEAEQKLSKAQGRLEVRLTRLNDLEAKLAKLQSPQQELETSIEEIGEIEEIEAGTSWQEELPESESASASSNGVASSSNVHPTSTFAEEKALMPPAEGQSDIAEDQNQAAAANTAEAVPHHTRRYTRRKQAHSEEAQPPQEAQTHEETL